MIPFVALNRDKTEMSEIKEAISGFLDRGKYVLGDSLGAFESRMSQFIQKKYCIGVGNATEALYLMFRALNLKRIGICASSPLPCGQAILMAGCEIVLYDSNDCTGLIDIDSFENDKRSIDALLAVHLYGQAEYADSLKKICDKKGIILLEDCSQSIDTYIGEKHTGAFSSMSAFSFYPTKNLGGFGDGGMVATDDMLLAEKLKKMRNYGQTKIYSAETEGINSRLDDLQAVILDVKMNRLKQKNERRREIMKRYKEGIKNDKISFAGNRYFETSNGHLMPLFCDKRDELKIFLEQNGISTAIHYPYPLHKQNAFKQEIILLNSEKISLTELSIPSFSEMTDEEVETVIKEINRF